MSATSAQCQGPNPQRYLDINLRFSTYTHCWGPMPQNTTAQLFLQCLRCTDVKAHTSPYGENNPSSILGSPDPDSSISTSQTFLICCAAMVQFVPWITRRHTHLAVNCTKKGLDPAHRWTPKCRCLTQAFTCEEVTWALITVNSVHVSCPAHPKIGT